ncbi:hypothetical protein [Saccharothrix deserti]|uniref:hypothetical protein n=1 Tax=Saccharothrix deserti TaxID=2593674 RepID=UPI00131C5DE1|nr:hypothetical protein [Saccharothrix deserti]
MAELPDTTDDAGIVVSISGDLDDDVTLLKEPPTLGAPANLHDFALVREASSEELRRYRVNYTPDKDRDHMSRRELYLYRGHALNAMLGAHEWRSVLRAVAERCNQSAESGTLVSLVFCNPASIVLRDLKTEYAYFQERSEDAWDLHFVGYRCQKKWSLRPSRIGIPMWRFDGKKFNEVRMIVQSEHRKYAEDSPFSRSGWTYSGRPEIVSFMAYGRYDEEFNEPRAHIDWPSLRAVPLVDANGSYIDYSLGEVVEAMSDWRERDGEVLRHLAPGELPIAASTLSIEGALKAVASALAIGITGNAAYELIKKVIGG